MSSRLTLETLSVPEEVLESLIHLSSHIEFSKECKKGGNGYLFFGLNTVLDRRVAVKYYYWGGDKRYHAEPKHLAQMASPNVVDILDASLLDNNYAYFVTPFYENGDLDDHIAGGIRGNRKAVQLAADILGGLTHLHSDRLLHRDIKPQNIFLSDEDTALIGDFGSVKKIPQGKSSVPGSGHSILYRPPESVETGRYECTGDIYQASIVLYQLLGGFLPYEETAWLNKGQLKKYCAKADSVDRTLYADKIMKEKIVHGRLIKIDSLPPWVCRPLKRVIRKACNTNSEKRFKSCSAFLAKLHQLLPEVKDWHILNGYPTLSGKLSYRIGYNRKAQSYFVEKKKSASWRRDNSFGTGTIEELVGVVEGAVGH